MSDAFSWLAATLRWPLLVALALGATAFAGWLGAQGRPLRNPAAPGGIVSFEFAWNRADAQRMIDSWAPLLATARRQVVIDFGFLLLYPAAIALGCAMLAASPSNGLPAAGVFLSWAVLLAAPLDAVENVALLLMLDRGATESLARLAGCCAGLKFVLVYAGLGYLILQGAQAGLRKLGLA